MGNDTKNEKAILWGFLLVILVFLVFISKNYYFDKSGSPQKNTGTQLPDNSKKVRQISDEELSKKILSGSLLSILDIRDNDSFKAEHIIDSKNVSPEESVSIISSPEKNKIYVFVSYSGENSTLIFPESLENTDSIYILSGGFENWKSNHSPTISAGDPTSFSDQSKVNYIKSEDLKKMLDENIPNLYILDIRDKNKFLESHIKNSVNIFLDDLESRRKEIPLGKKIIICGENGFDGFQAAVRLFDLGILNVYTMPEGLSGWSQKGFEMAK